MSNSRRLKGQPSAVAPVNRSCRFHLLGKYRTPRFSYGSIVLDDVRGWVEIVGLTDAPIPWPIV
jgi:hypothetical protein